MGAKLLTGGILAVIGLFTVKLVLAVLSGVAALFGFLFFTVLPIVIVGWLVIWFYRKLTDDPGYDPAD